MQELSTKGGVSIVIPAFNEESGIASVIDGIRAVLNGTEYELIVVDDGSVDLTAEVARESGAEAIRMRKNMGYGRALTSGFQFCKYQIVVSMDGDGQYDPRDIPSLVEPILRGTADVVVGSRFLERSKRRPGSMGWGDNLSNRIFSLLLGMTVKMNLTDTQSNFRAYKKEATQRLELKEYGLGFGTEFLLKARQAGYRIGEVPVTYRPRGYTSYSSFRVMQNGIRVFDIALRYLLGRPL